MKKVNKKKTQYLKYLFMKKSRTLKHVKETMFESNCRKIQNVCNPQF